MFAPPNSPHTLAWSAALTSRSYAVDVCGMDQTHSAWLRVRLLVVGLAARCSRSTQDLTVVHSLGAHGLLALLAGVRGRVTVVPWGSEVLGLQTSPVGRLVARRLLERADAVIVTSEAMRHLLSTELGLVASEKVHVISWGVDVQQFGQVMSDREVAETRSLYLCGVQERLFVSPRGTKSVYRHEEVLEAFAAARSLGCPAKLVVVGHRSADAPRPAQSRDDVIYAGWLTKARLAKLFGSADLIISIPRSDQRSTAVLEALASGTPVALSTIEAYEELVRDGAEPVLLSEPIAASLTSLMLASHPRREALCAVNTSWARRVEDAASQMLLIGRVVEGPVPP
jgi:glycosyltransferase involved in cell wall biosynthesis